MKPKIVRQFRPLSFLFLIIIIGFWVSCKKNKICPCDTSEPFDESEWMKEVQMNIESKPKICYADMTLYKWDGLYYILQRTAIDSIYDEPNLLYDCEGNKIQEFGGTSCKEIYSDFYSKGEELQTLWTYENTPCSCAADEEFVQQEWLEEIINEFENRTDIIRGDVSLYEWKNRYYIRIGIFYGAYDLPNSLFDCNGNLMYNIGGLQQKECSVNFLREAQKIETLWKK